MFLIFSFSYFNLMLCINKAILYIFSLLELPWNAGIFVSIYHAKPWLRETDRVYWKTYYSIHFLSNINQKLFPYLFSFTCVNNNSLWMNPHQNLIINVWILQGVSFVSCSEMFCKLNFRKNNFRYELRVKMQGCS